MKITIQFLNGSPYWQALVTKNAAEAAQALSDSSFQAWIKAWPGFDYTGDTPEQVADRLASTTELKICVGFYSSFFTRAIAYEENGCVYFNTRKEKYGAGSKGNIAHECMHALGYQHDGNSPKGNENTVPWRVGEWVETWKVSEPVAQPTLATAENSATLS